MIKVATGVSNLKIHVDKTANFFYTVSVFNILNHGGKINEYGEIYLVRLSDEERLELETVVKKTKTSPELFPAFRERLLEIVKPVYGRIGWGYGDGVFATVADIYAFHGLGLEHSGHWKPEYEFTVNVKNKSESE